MFKPSLLAASVAACSSFAIAAETTLPTQIVTATRTTQTADEALASVQVIDRATLDKYPTQDLGEILRFTTGIDIVRAGGLGGQTSIFTRGTESNHTLVLIDGVRINSATSSQANIQHLTLSDVERVEVVKGPMSSLYGSEAIGGVINIITKTASKTQSQAIITAGSDSLISGSVTQTVKQGNFSALVNANALYINGYETVSDSSVDRGQKNQGGHISANYDFGAASIGFSVRENKGTTEYLNGIYSGFSVVGFTPRTQDFVNQLISLNASADLNDQLNTTLRLSQMKDELDQNQSKGKAHTKQQQLDWQNTLAISNADTLIAGLVLTDTKAQYNTAYDKSLKNKAFYLQNQWQNAGFSVQASARHEDYDSFGTHTTGNVGLGYTFAANQLIYVNAGTAFKAPDLNELYDPYSGNPDLKPEESRSVEIGSRHQWGDFSLTTAFFKNNLDNLITYGPAPTYALKNIDKATTKGVELGSKWSANGVFIGVNGSYVNAQDSNSKTDLDRRPRRTITVSSGYQDSVWGVSGDILGKSHTQDFAGRIAGYAVANVQAYWQVLPTTKLRLNVENITDKRYSGAYFDSGYLYLATPRSASLSAEVKF